MYKYLSKVKVFIPLVPPLGDVPNELDNTSIESFIWGANEEEEVRIKFYKPLRKTDTLSEEDLPKLLNYDVEIYCISNSIEHAASRSIFLLEQSLDTSSLWSQAAGKTIQMESIVNLTEIENIIQNKKGSFEKGVFAKYKLSDLKSFPPGRLIFLSDQGAKKIGRNLFWFRRGLIELTSLNRFVYFYTAFSQLGEYFKELVQYSSIQKPLIYFLEDELKYPKDTFKKWADLRNKILHFGNKQEDFQLLNREAKENLGDIYTAAYYGICKFFTDSPPAPSKMIIFDDIEKEIVEASPELVQRLTEIHEARNKGYSEILLKQ